MATRDLRYLLCALVLALSVGVTAPAAAEGIVSGGRDVTLDPTGDVVRLDLDRRNIETGRSDAPDTRQGDVRRTVLKHTRRNVIVHVRAAELDRTGYMVRIYVGLRTGSGRAYNVVQETRHNESFRPDPISLQRRNGKQWRCDDARVRWRWTRDAVSVRIPRSCLGNPRFVRSAPTIVTRYATPDDGFYLVADDSYDSGYERQPSYGPFVRSR